MAIPKIVLATRNKKKLEEMQMFAKSIPCDFVTIGEVGKNIPFIEETGKTYQENAVEKALGVARAAGLPALADDSGLEVEVLKGEPGPNSSSYAGEDATDDENNRKLINALRMMGVPAAKRKAQYRCVLVLADPNSLGEDYLIAEASCAGTILEAAKGKSGFGYDPLFLSADLKKTFAEATWDEKAKISHRAKAFKLIREEIVRHYRLK